MEYEGTKATAARWGIDPRVVRWYAKKGRIPGVERIGHDWLIPKDAEKPKARPPGPKPKE